MSQYQAPNQYYPPGPAPTNVLAAVSFVLGLCGLAILPVILGHIALSQIRSRGESGAWLAVIGLVLGYLEIVAYVIIIAAVGGFIAWGVNQ